MFLLVKWFCYAVFDAGFNNYVTKLLLLFCRLKGFPANGGYVLVSGRNLPLYALFKTLPNALP
ncbi:MAG: hypothetical protein EAZ16_12830 [Sphingobacteriales bacterium]|nr:MAG: hypothetical protein EAZ16_12830 [Sphingobacteriales bacterium]